jgi:hypothetical protein
VARPATATTRLGPVAKRFGYAVCRGGVARRRGEAVCRGGVLGRCAREVRRGAVRLGAVGRCSQPLLSRRQGQPACSGGADSRCGWAGGAVNTGWAVGLGCLEEASRFSGSPLVVGNRPPNGKDLGMARMGGLLEGRAYGPSVRPRRCSIVAPAPSWEWRCTRDRCRLADPEPRILDGRYSESNRRRCAARQPLRDVE